MAPEEGTFDPKELLLAMIHANGGRIEGRTVVQKLCYFLAEKLGLNLGFRPHYYGPFSTRIEETTDLLVSQGLLHETIERLPTIAPTTGFELRKYTYELTARGREYIRQHGLESQREYRELVQLLDQTRRWSGLNPSVLSAAAKIHFIVSSEEKPLSHTKILEKAKDIGWELGKGEVEKITELLVSLGFLEEPSD